MYNINMNNSGIMQLTNYEQALRHYEAVQPIKGYGVNAGLRPLGARNKPHFQIIKHNNDAIACRLYKTDVVTFHPDNRITFATGNYNTSTTANFVAQILGRPCSKFNNRLVLHVNSGGYTVNGSLVLQATDNGRYEVMKCERDIVHTVDRKAMNAVRKEYQDFINYVSGMMKMQEYKIDKELLAIGLAPVSEGMPSFVPRLNVEAWNSNYMQISTVMEKFLQLVRSKDSGNWYLSFLWLVHTSPHNWNTSTIRFTHNAVMETLNDIIIAKHTHVLKPTVLEAGQIKIDRYKKFKPYMEEA